MELSRGTWRLRGASGDYLVVRAVGNAAHESPSSREPVSVADVRVWFGRAVSGGGIEGENRRVVLEIYRAVTGHQSFMVQGSVPDLHRTALPAVMEAFARGTLRAHRHRSSLHAHRGTPPAPAPAGSGASGSTSPTVGQLVVQISTPLGAGIGGVTVTANGRTLTTSGAGVADFGMVPAGSYSVRAQKADYGPVPGAGSVFAVGDATITQAVPAGQTTTVALQMVTVQSVTVSHTPEVAATPLRIYKRVVGAAHVEHVITCSVACPLTAASGPGTQIPVRVDWTFTADGANAPKAKGGKDNTDSHFASAPGSAMSGAGTTTASTTTNNAGETSITFRASVTAGDRFTVHARVLRSPGNPGAGDLGHGDSPRFEVWRRLDYRNLYRMQTGANAGFNLGPAATVANIQPAFTPAFTEYTVGTPNPIPYREYITSLVAPTAAQLPLNGVVRIRSSDPADRRAVTIHGLVVAAGGSTSAGTEVLTLGGTAPVVGATTFQQIARVTVSPSPGATLTVETAAGAAVAHVAPGSGAAAPGFLFDTVAAVQAKAQAWYNANDAQMGADLTALATSIGASGYFMVGAAYYHPKVDGRAGTGRTTFYAGYPGVRITYYSTSFHPDAEWGNTDGVNLGQMSCLFLNLAGGAYASMVARHEIGHASDHVSYGPGDHCPQSTCLMYAFSTNNQFCTIAPDHSLNRTKGWSP